MAQYGQSSGPPGRQLLKVSGILLIIFGSLGLLFTLLGSVLVGFLGGIFGGAVGATLGVGVMLISSASSVLQLVAGILGVRNAANPQKATALMVLGIIMVALVVINLISNFDFVTMIGLVLPVLYLIGAVQNRS